MYFHIKPCVNDFKMPSRGTPDSVGYDLHVHEDGEIPALSRRLIPLGFMASFTPGWVARYFDRSGMGNKGITHFAGTIDPDFRGEWKVILYNSTAQVFKYSAGDRLIQVVFLPVGLPEPSYVSTLEDTVRGLGEFGSTGK